MVVPDYTKPRSRVWKRNNFINQGQKDVEKPFYECKFKKIHRKNVEVRNIKHILTRTPSYVRSKYQVLERQNNSR